MRKKLKVLALDFDGTLVESNKIKDNAFYSIFGEWPEHRDAMMQMEREARSNQVGCLW